MRRFLLQICKVACRVGNFPDADARYGIDEPKIKRIIFSLKIKN